MGAPAADPLLRCAGPECGRPLYGRRLAEFPSGIPTCSKRCSMAVLRLRPVPADARGSFTRDGFLHVRLPPDDPYASMADALGYVREHRLVAARRLGRPLLPGERVLHQNGNEQDNRPENLVVVQRRRRTSS